MTTKKVTAGASKYKLWTIVPIVWLPFYFFILGPALAGPRSNTVGISVTVAAITAIAGIVGECILLAWGAKGWQKFFAILGVVFSLLLLFYAYIVYGFSLGPNRFTW